jgi:hypothetical protein
MATLKQLGSLPPITVELGLFDYVPLDNPREPPAIALHARLARSYDTDDEDGEGLRLAFVAGHPVDSHDLLVLAYLWRGALKGVVWGVERWSSPERRLAPYRYDPTFEPGAAADVHSELQGLGPGAFASYAHDLLAS